MKSSNTYLINLDNEIFQTWSYPSQGNMAYLLPNGNILRLASAFTAKDNPFAEGGSGGLIQEINHQDEVVWEYTLANDNQLLHHGVEVLPNGNILLICWEKLSE